jgi:hypothetical protein
VFNRKAAGMNLPESGFSKFTGMGLCDGRAVEIIYHSYESEKKIYDVLLVRGTKLYNLNTKPALNVSPIHREIERHYKI